MPSQEEYLDNLLKGIETDNIEAEDTENPKMTGTEEETAKTPETSEPVEESATQVDMSDMDDLLKSAYDAQKADSTEPEAEESQPISDNTAIHPEETASMSEDEIDRLLQKSQEQSEDVPAQENSDTNDDLIKMLEDADDEGLSNILDQVTPETAQPETITAQPEEDDGKRGKKRKKKEKKKEKNVKEKKPGFFDRFKKKPKEEPAEQETAPGETEAVPAADAEVVSEIPEAVPDDLADLVDLANLTSLTPNTGSTENVAAAASDSTESENTESTGDTAESGDANVLDGDLDALLAGAFPEQADGVDNASGEPDSADVMDILKAAGADIVEEPEQKKDKKGFFAKLLDLFTEEDEEEEESDQLKLSDENKKILEEMDKGGKKKKGKKEKKPKKEKQPKSRKTAKEKKKKEKPEKKGQQAVPEKKLSPQKIIPIMAVCITLGAVILLLGNFLMDYTAKRSGRKAYYAGDYQTCYQNLFGKELNETEQVMYSHSESILTIRMWLREYEVFVNEGSELEALDSLLQAVHDYPTLLNYATQWNAQDEVNLAFQDILNILSQKYQLSQEEAQQIADISDNVEYTKNVMMALQKLGLGSWEFPQGNAAVDAPTQSPEETPAQLPDPLPEEKEIQQ